MDNVTLVVWITAYTALYHWLETTQPRQPIPLTIGLIVGVVMYITPDPEKRLALYNQNSDWLDWPWLLVWIVINVAICSFPWFKKRYWSV
ncbi:hypothetical protein HBA55_36515 [Pseudomaricurvus alkylphenolicus]|uniref:hypothetical protein n=1 Tax=Pseudomaricurvus alkylphenolicus TaxID=1306991 RepID=UPI00141DB6BC|nr:hypothetical protein [Pseudomaricurvus alkylphenolicus]NIB45140.1 hypothetical protein [Pseudomaricurvus alkylphenolicus]